MEEEREGGREGGKNRTHLDDLLPLLGQDHFGYTRDRFVPGGRTVTAQLGRLLPVFFLLVAHDVLV